MSNDQEYSNNFSNWLTFKRAAAEFDEDELHMALAHLTYLRGDPSDYEKEFPGTLYAKGEVIKVDQITRKDLPEQIKQALDIPGKNLDETETIIYYSADGHDVSLTTLERYIVSAGISDDQPLQLYPFLGRGEAEQIIRACNTKSSSQEDGLASLQSVLYEIKKRCPDDSKAFAWLRTFNEPLGQTPLAALKRGEVMQVLNFVIADMPHWGGPIAINNILPTEELRNENA
jgi:hypothetical protein